MKRKKICNLIIVIILGAIILINLRIYFAVYPTQLSEGIAGDQNATIATITAKHVAASPVTIRSIDFITLPYLYGDFSTIRFLLPNTYLSSGYPGDFIGHSASVLGASTTDTYVIRSDQTVLISELKNTYPNGRLIKIDGLGESLKTYLFQP